MKNYTILEENPEIKKQIQDQIKIADLESNLLIQHKSTTPNSCSVEVNYKIKSKDKKDPWFGNTLRIYVNDDNPLIRSYDSFWTGYSPNDNSTSLGVIAFGPLLVRLYSDKRLNNN